MNHFSNLCTECAKYFLQIPNGNVSFFSAISLLLHLDITFIFAALCAMLVVCDYIR